MYRYLAILWNPRKFEDVHTLHSFDVAVRSAPAEWSIAYERPGLWIAHTDVRRGAAQTYPLGSSSGVILGKLFAKRHSSGLLHDGHFRDREVQTIVSGGGQHLIEHYWGSYVAIIHDEVRRKQHVLRDPMGNVPCYHINHKRADIFFSHIEDCVRLLSIPFSINRHYLTRWLIFNGLTSRNTGIENTEEIAGGERLTISEGEVTRTLLWNPIEISRTPYLEQADEAAKELRSTVQNSINAWASCYQSIVHRLSGGLDSSVVAGCLAQAPHKPQITYLNLSIDVGFDQQRVHLPGIDKGTAARMRALSGHGDERYFARLVAERWKTPLVERERSVSMDLARLWQTPLSVSPALYFAVMEMDDAEIELATTYGTEAFFSGQGGDCVFLATSQPLPAIDYAYLYGIRRGLWQQLVATSNLSKESLWSVLGKTIEHGILRRPHCSPVSILRLPTLLNEELIENLTNDDFESDLTKLAARSSLPPGKKNHIGGLAGSAYYNFVFHSEKYADHIDPLNSQPVWELMLRIPTYTVLTDGVSRGLARRAFADLLPPEIRVRQVKGSGMSFYQQVVRNNMGFLREKLLGGLLVREGYLDRQKLEDCLGADEPFMKVYASSMLSYLAAEVWLQQWLDTQQMVGTRRRAAL